MFCFQKSSPKQFFGVISVLNVYFENKWEMYRQILINIACIYGLSLAIKISYIRSVRYHTKIRRDLKWIFNEDVSADLKLCHLGSLLPFWKLKWQWITKHFRYLKWRYSPINAVCKAYVRGNPPQNSLIRFPYLHFRYFEILGEWNIHYLKTEMYFLLNIGDFPAQPW